MNKELQLWEFISIRLSHGEDVVLLVVAESTGSSPGRPGYKMAVASGGELCGSVGGGVMEVNLVERSRALLSVPRASATGSLKPQLIEQVHQKNSRHSSGMICSGRQTIILAPLSRNDLQTIEMIGAAVNAQRRVQLNISENGTAATSEGETGFSRQSDANFSYNESLGHARRLYIVGGGHCSLALSEQMSKLDFRITILDDRPELNTVEKNRFAHEIRIVENYANIAELIPPGPDVYVVVMTLGYASDEIAIRCLINHELKYFGVLGSKAKMKVLLKSLEDEGIPADMLSRIRTPIGLPINSHTPEEIAVSIAAEIIAVKNASE